MRRILSIYGKALWFIYHYKIKKLHNVYLPVKKRREEYPWRPPSVQDETNTDTRQAAE